MGTEADRIAELEAQVAKFSQQNADLIAEGKATKANGLRAAAEQKFEAAIAAKRLFPAHRERFFKWTYPKDHEGVIAFDASEVERYIKENEVMPATSAAGAKGAATTTEEGKTPDVVVVQRVRQFMAENEGVSYKDAMVAVLRDDDVLAEDYRQMPDKLFK